MADPDQRCSQADRIEPPLGTAIEERRILIVEQRGFWGPRAWEESGLHERLAGALAEAGQCRVLLARHPRRTGRGGSERRWWSISADAAGLITARSGSVRRGEPLGPEVWRGEPTGPPEPEIFVCTNGRRDRCCGESGRALVQELDGHPRLWEASDLTGHRFAATALSFPDGLMTGRLGRWSVEQLLAGQTIALGGVRGRVGRSPQRQVAEYVAAGWAAQSRELEGRRPLVWSRSVDERTVEVHAHRAAWLVELKPAAIPARPRFCGGDPEPAQAWTVESMVPVRGRA